MHHRYFVVSFTPPTEIRYDIRLDQIINIVYNHYIIYNNNSFNILYLKKGIKYYY